MSKKKGLFWDSRADRSVQCYLCAHHCTIAKENYGICGVRKNINGELFTFAYGNIIAENIDPVEKKPLYHFLPGTDTYSIAISGCNFRCSFCQNWTISQNRSVGNESGENDRSPQSVVDKALNNECKSISYTYTEPVIFFEYARETAIRAKAKGLKNIFVTNGFMSDESAENAAKFLDAANIDLKFFSDNTYKELCNGRLAPVLNTISFLKSAGVWIEITTLIVPGLNDSESELGKIAEYIAGVDPDMPWHVSRFHPDYKYTDIEVTPVEAIERAVKIGKVNGLKYVYPGNINADIDTYCPNCGQHLIRRLFGLKNNDFFESGRCVKCGEKIPGVWARS